MKPRPTTKATEDKALHKEPAHEQRYGRYNQADARGPVPFPYPPVIKTSPPLIGAAAENWPAILGLPGTSLKALLAGSYISAWGAPPETSTFPFGRTTLLPPCLYRPSFISGPAMNEPVAGSNSSLEL